MNKLMFLVLWFVFPVALCAQNTHRLTVIPDQAGTKSGTIRFQELTGNGYNYLDLKGADLISGNRTITIPDWLTDLTLIGHDSGGDVGKRDPDINRPIRVIHAQALNVAPSGDTPISSGLSYVNARQYNFTDYTGSLVAWSAWAGGNGVTDSYWQLRDNAGSEVIRFVRKQASEGTDFADVFVDLRPSPTDTQNLGSSGQRWLGLWVNDIDSHHIKPATAITYDLGTPTLKWRAVYAQDLTVDGNFSLNSVTLSGSDIVTKSGSQTITGDKTFGNVTITGICTGCGTVPPNMVTTDTTQTISGAKTFSAEVNGTTGFKSVRSIEAGSNGYVAANKHEYHVNDTGVFWHSQAETNTMWRLKDNAAGVFLQAETSPTRRAVLTGSFIPNGNNLYDLGDTNWKWKDGLFSGRITTQDLTITGTCTGCPGATPPSNMVTTDTYQNIFERKFFTYDGQDVSIMGAGASVLDISHYGGTKKRAFTIHVNDAGNANSLIEAYWHNGTTYQNRMTLNYLGDLSIGRNMAVPGQLDVTGNANVGGMTVYGWTSFQGDVMNFYKSGAPADEKYWRWYQHPTDGWLRLQLINDAYSGGGSILELDRNGTTPAAFNIFAPTTVNGNLTVTGTCTGCGAAPANMMTTDTAQTVTTAGIKTFAASINFQNTLSFTTAAKIFGHLVPTDVSLYDLGSSANRWRTTYTATLNVGNATNQGLSNHLYPSLDSTYSLGASSFRYNNIFSNYLTLSGGSPTIYVGGTGGMTQTFACSVGTWIKGLTIKGGIITDAYCGA